jgi:hypothetical protein
MALESPRTNGAGKTSLGVTIVLVATGLVTVAASIIALSGRWTLILPIWHRVLGRSIHPTLPQLVLALSTILLYLAGCRLLYRRQAWIFLAWSLFGGVAIRLGVLALAGKPLDLLFACTTSQYCSGGFVLGWQMTPATLNQWPALMPGLRPYYPHLGISAPGWALLYRGLSQGLERLPTISDALSTSLRPLGCNQWEFNSLSDAQVASAWLGIAAPLWAALTALPLYGLGRKVADEDSARAALVWWPLVLAAALFAASPSLTYTLPATAIVALLWSGITSRAFWRRSLQLILAGGLLGATLVMSFSLMPLLLLCGGLILCRFVQESGPRIGPVLRRSAAVALPLGLGLIGVWGVYSLLAGHSPLTLLRIAMGLHLDSGSGLSYLTAMGLNAWDFILFAGLPICGLAIASAFSKRLPGVSCLATALGGTLLVLLFSGTARGEVARVWAFFMPFVVLLGATVFRQLRPDLRRSLLAGQVLLLVTFAATFTPQHTQARPLPSYGQAALPPLQAPESAADATFGDALHLSGYQAEYRPATQTLALALKWRTLRRTDMPYYFSAVLVAPDGHPLPGVVWQPFADLYPTSCWQPNQPIVDQIALPLGPDSAAGDWWLSLRAFGILADQQLPPLPVSLPDGTVDTQLGLGPLRVNPQ